MSAAIFISDLHLCVEQPALRQRFVGFLAHEARMARTLYILGDLFEVWLGDDASLPTYAEEVAALRSCTTVGVTIYVMHGNRDFLLGTAFAQASGAQLIADPARLDLDGVPWLLMHGDTLCTDDVEYQRFRAMVRDPAWQAALLARTPAERAALAAQYRAQSKQLAGMKAPEIMDVNEEAVQAVLRAQGVQGLIHGHTHRPARHALYVDGRAAERLVLPDWRVEKTGEVSGGYGYWQAGKMQIVPLT